jgi:hypothetical protein
MELKQICQYVNALRDRYGANELIQEDLKKALPSELKKRIYELELNGIVHVRKDGVRKMYSFPKEPIHISKFDFLNKKTVKSSKPRKLNEKECITFLKSLGYKILQKQYVEV